MQNLLLSDTVVTVTDSVTELIQVYAVNDFAQIFCQDEIVWFIWSQQGWTCVTSVEKITVDAKAALSLSARHEPEQKVRPSCFVAIHNNRNLVSCSESCMLLLANHETQSAAEIAHDKISPMVIQTPRKSHNATSHDGPVVQVLLRHVSIRPLAQLVHAYTRLHLTDLDLSEPFDRMYKTLACASCRHIFTPGRPVHYQQTALPQGKHWLFYCEPCLDRIVDGFQTQLVEQKAMRERGWSGSMTALHHAEKRCNTCNKKVAEHEVCNFAYQEHHGKPICKKLYWFPYCTECYGKLCEQYTRERYKYQRITHPFQVISAACSLENLEHDAQDMHWYRQLFEQFDQTGEGEFDVRNQERNLGLVLSQLLLMLGERLQYPCLHFTVANSFAPRFYLQCTEALAEKFRPQEFHTAEDAYRDYLRTYAFGQPFHVEYYWINSCGTRLFRPDYRIKSTKRCTDAEDDYTPETEHRRCLHHYDLPMVAFRITTASGCFQAGLGGLVFVQAN